MPRLEYGVVQGPYNVTGVSDTPTRERIFVCRPTSVEEEPACASQILSSLARRAFRRSVNAEDIGASLAFYNTTSEIDMLVAGLHAVRELLG